MKLWTDFQLWAPKMDAYYYIISLPIFFLNICTTSLLTGSMGKHIPLLQGKKYQTNLTIWLVVSIYRLYCTVYRLYCTLIQCTLHSYRYHRPRRPRSNGRAQEEGRMPGNLPNQQSDSGQRPRWAGDTPVESAAPGWRSLQLECWRPRRSRCRKLSRSGAWVPSCSGYAGHEHWGDSSTGT